MNSFDLKELEGIVRSYTKPVERETKGLVAARSGIMSLDLNLGGGFPSGLVEIYGRESVGKTALAGQIAAYNQRSGRQVAWLGSERIDRDYLHQLGVILKYLPIISEKDVEEFFASFGRAVVVVDSLTAIRPLDVDDWNAFIFDYLSDLRELIRPGQCIVATSHVRSRKSVNPRKTFTGGLESAARRITDLFDCRLELSRESVSDKGYTQVVNITANVLATPSRYLKLPSHKGYGADRVEDLVGTANSLDVIERRGSHIYFEGYFLGQGKKAAVQTVRQQPGLEERIIDAILAQVA